MKQGVNQASMHTIGRVDNGALSSYLPNMSSLNDSDDFLLLRFLTPLGRLSASLLQGAPASMGELERETGHADETGETLFPCSQCSATLECPWGWTRSQTLVAQ